MTDSDIPEDTSSNYYDQSEWAEVAQNDHRFIIRIPSKDTDGAYSVLEVLATQRQGTPIHIHDNEDEFFLILEGTGRFANGDKRLDVAVGGALTVSKGVPHAWCNLSETPLRIPVLFTPGGIDAAFLEITKRGNVDFAVMADKFGTRVVGPMLLNSQ
jgi:mannose-6-phosphate isomerase-like protein (cupin superfamily)